VKVQLFSKLLGKCLSNVSRRYGLASDKSRDRKRK